MYTSFICMSVCLCEYMPYMCRYLLSLKEVIESPGARVTHSCEQLTWALGPELRSSSKAGNIDND